MTHRTDQVAAERVSVFLAPTFIGRLKSKKETPLTRFFDFLRESLTNKTCARLTELRLDMYNGDRRVFLLADRGRTRLGSTARERAWR